MKSKQIPLIVFFNRYGSILVKQARENREYMYFWLAATILDIAIFETFKPWAWVLVALANVLIGMIAIASLVRPFDKAFETLPLDYEKGYGKPTWIVRGKYPIQKENIRIRAAGYDASDFEKFIPQIASRLNRAVQSVRKPLTSVPEIEITLKSTHVPELVKFDDLDFSALSAGDFYVGLSAEGSEVLSLSKMVHMLVAGQTGGGKTQFLRQLMATVLYRAREALVCLIDMKGGIDFQSFIGTPGFELVARYEQADYILDKVLKIYEKRRDYILSKKKSNWAEFTMHDLENETSLKGEPLGPVVLVVDELAELSKKATAKSAKSELQEKIATLARLARFTGIHLILGTQRPDKNVIDMQSKDNLPTRICFSVPSVVASTLVVGDMTASTLGNHPGRAVYQLASTKIVQTPLISNTKIEEMMNAIKERKPDAGSERGLFSLLPETASKSKKVDFS